MRFVLALFCLLPPALLAQEVKVRLWDGRSLQGRFEKAGEGKCRILAGDVSHDFEEGDIVSLEVVPSLDGYPAFPANRGDPGRLTVAARVVGAIKVERRSAIVRIGRALSRGVGHGVPARSAKKDAPPLCKNLKEFYPLALGDYWVYKVGESDVLQRMEITEVLPENGEVRVYYTLEVIYKNYRSSKVGQLVAEGDSVFPAAGLGGIGRKAFPLLRFPAKVGDTWEAAFDSQKVIREVCSVTATVATPAGSFSGCMEIMLTTITGRGGEETRVVSRRFYAPRVGMVKLEFDDLTYRKLNLELVEYGSK